MLQGFSFQSIPIVSIGRTRSMSCQFDYVSRRLGGNTSEPCYGLNVCSIGFGCQRRRRIGDAETSYFVEFII